MATYRLKMCPVLSAGVQVDETAVVKAGRMTHRPVRTAGKAGDTERARANRPRCLRRPPPLLVVVRRVLPLQDDVAGDRAGNRDASVENGDCDG